MVRSEVRLNAYGMFTFGKVEILCINKLTGYY